MTKIDIFSGFLGAGKTTLIKKLIAEAYSGEKLVLIENEFGEIAIDGGFLKDAGIEITEMNSGCICCTLVGDFGKALQKVMEEYSPDRILIEPSGVGKLSDVIAAVEKIDGVVLNGTAAVVDAKRCKMYLKNFGEFFGNQIENAGAIILSRTGDLSEDKLHQCVHLIKERNAEAPIVTTPWDDLDGKQILAAIEGRSSLKKQLAELEHHHHHAHDHEHDENCTCGCHDHEHEHRHTHEHSHEHHHEHAHEHTHDHGENCTCGCHDHDHHHHDADEVFVSWGFETVKKYSKQQLEAILEDIENEKKYGIVLRAKGIVEDEAGGWIHFDYVPGEADVRSGSADIAGRICVIGSNLDQSALTALFGE